MYLTWASLFAIISNFMTKLSAKIKENLMQNNKLFTEIDRSCLHIHGYLL